MSEVLQIIGYLLQQCAQKDKSIEDLTRQLIALKKSDENQK